MRSAADSLDSDSRPARLRGALSAARGGFTIPELAVIVAVLVCVAAVAAPYLLKMWETSRQVQCRERLKIQAVAIVRHQDEKQKFPPGQIARLQQKNAVGRYADPAEARDTGAKPVSGASWLVSVLPYADRKDLYDQWDQKRSVLGNAAVAQVNLPFMYCPSRRGDLGGAGLIRQCDRVSESWTGGGNDYAACNGSGITFNDEARQTWDLDEAQIAATTRNGMCPYSSAPEHRGISGVNSQVTRADVEAADGLAFVILLSERRVFRNPPSAEQRSSDGWAWGGPATLLSTRFAPHSGLHYDEADSEHPGLVNAAMADARVRPVSWNIDLRTWSNLGNYAQGSPIEHPEFRR
jgi:type II secretory pathway pseudopilin PulG